MSQPNFNSVGIGVLLVIIFVIIAVFTWMQQTLNKHNADLVRENQILTTRLNLVEINQAVQARAIIPLSAGVLSQWVGKLTHAHTQELDSLMTLIGPPSTMSPEQHKRFEALLNERVISRDDPSIDEEERAVARMLPLFMAQVDRDYAALRRFPTQLTTDMSAMEPPLTAKEAVDEKKRSE